MKIKKKRISIAISEDLIEEIKKIQTTLQKNSNPIAKVSFSAIIEKILREGLKIEKIKRELGI